jgi:hypothetical protein
MTTSIHGLGGDEKENEMNTTTKKEIAKLNTMKLNELQARFAMVIGEKTRSPNRTFLIRRIAETLQAVDSEVKKNTLKLSKSKTTDDVAKAAEVRTATPKKNEKLTDLDIPELQARYIKVVGRPTNSSNRAYLVLKIREAQKGRIPVGPPKNARREGVTFKVLPLRIESDLVAKLDEAWKRLGLHSRMDLFRRSLRAFLQSAGDHDLAALLATSRD